MEPGQDTISIGSLERRRIRGATFAAIASDVLEKADVNDVRSFGIFLLAPYLLMEAWSKLRTMEARKAP